jgi:hypothetical protein
MAQRSHSFDAELYPLVSFHFSRVNGNKSVSARCPPTPRKNEASVSARPTWPTRTEGRCPYAHVHIARQPRMAGRAAWWACAEGVARNVGRESASEWEVGIVARNVSCSGRPGRQEIFGPVMSILKFSTPDEAIRRANQSNYGDPAPRGPGGQSRAAGARRAAA